MGKATPSMTALLGLLAVAGYQNREKIGELIGKAKDSLGTLNQAPQKPAPSGELLNDFSTMFDNTKTGDTLSSGLNDVFDTFKQSGEEKTVDSWVSTSVNQQLDPVTLEKTLGDETLDDLVAKTGLQKADILARLSTSLPCAVDHFTPEGHLPNAAEASKFR